MRFQLKSFHRKQAKCEDAMYTIVITESAIQFEKTFPGTLRQRFLEKNISTRLANA